MTLPNLIIAMITTMGTNFRILIQHPALVLLPAYTFFSYRAQDHKIMFSKKMTMLNMLINGLCFGIVFVQGQVGQFDVEYKRSHFQFFLLVASLPLLVMAILLSMVFIYMEKWCGCCCLSVSCCNIKDKEEIFDPDQEDVQDQDGVEMEEVQVKEEEQQK